MKVFKISMALVFCIFLISCTNDEIVTSSSNTIGNNQTLLKSQQQSLIGGLFWEDGNANHITEFYSYGWRSIQLPVELDLPTNPANLASWTAANNSGYYPKLANIYRPFIASDNRENTHLLIDLARANNAQWIYIDDFLTSFVTGQGNEISQSAIDDLCAYAHKEPPYQSISGSRLDVAVAEDCKSVYIWGEIETYWSLYNHIDIIMPYGYERKANNIQNQPEYMYNHLYNFYNYLKNTKHKRVIPCLGYKTNAGPNNDQLGSDSNPDGFNFIGRALSFADQPMIFFYTDGSIGDRLDLTTYLQTHSYIVSQPFPF